MTLIALGSVKGSPGVTTTAMALAATWPGHRLVLAEVDAAGGDLASRFGLPAEPGLVSLATAARRDPRAELIWDHCQTLPGELRVLTAPAASEQTAWGVRVLGDGLFGSLADTADVDVVADCGRLDALSPALAIARQAQLLILVTRPVLSELNHVGERLAALRNGPAETWLILVGRGPWKAAEVSHGLGGVVIAGELPEDTVAAAMLAGAGRRGVRAARRLPLVRGARSIAESICVRLPALRRPATPPPPPSPPQALQAAEAVS
jgi:hypothetical protein